MREGLLQMDAVRPLVLVVEDVEKELAVGDRWLLCVRGRCLTRNGQSVMGGQREQATRP